MLFNKLVPVLCCQCEYLTLHRFCSTFKIMPLLNFKSKLSNDQQQIVLETINQCTVEQLCKFDMSRTRIKNLDVWRNKKGPFTSLTDILEVEGLGVNVLERLCTSILTKKYTEPQALSPVEDMTVKRVSRIRKSLLIPNLLESRIMDIRSATGIHVAAMNISWAQITAKDNYLSNWNYLDCSKYPKKMMPNNTFELAQKLLKEIPPSDVYIFEAGPNISANCPQQAMSLVTYANHLELISMMLALINTSPTHNNCLVENHSVENEENRVFFLKSKVSARLFQTLIGSERVSACATVSNILKHSKANDILPCTPVQIRRELQDEYETISSIHKDFLGQALILTVAFMDLCVYRNATSLKAIAAPRRKTAPPPQNNSPNTV